MTLGCMTAKELCASGETQPGCTGLEETSEHRKRAFPLYFAFRYFAITGIQCGGYHGWTAGVSARADLLRIPPVFEDVVVHSPMVEGL
eukprot:s363_g37.t1